MSDTTESDMQVFLEETREILDEMQNACHGPNDEKSYAILERGLHTLRGNAAAFSLDRYSEVAEHVLGTLRASRKGGASAALPSGDRQLVFRFIAKSHEFLNVIKKSGSISSGFFRDIQPARDRSDGLAIPVQTPPVDLKRSTEETWQNEVNRILSQAPVVVPAVEELAQMAARDLERERTEAPPAAAAPEEELEPERDPDDAAQMTPASEAEPPPEAAPEEQEDAELLAKASDFAEGPVAPGAYGYAFEASCLSETIRRLAQGPPTSDGGIGVDITHTAELLTSFSQWAVEARKVPLAPYLEQAAEYAGTLAQSLENSLAVKVSGDDAHVLPLVGDLVCFLLKQIFSASLPIRQRGGQARDVIPVSLRAESRQGSTVCHLSGLASFARAAAGPQPLELQERVAEVGGRIDPGSRGDEIFLTLPDDFHCVEILTAHTGCSVIGIPWHRIVEIRERRIPEERGEEGVTRIRWGEGEIDLHDLREPEDDTGRQRQASLVVILGTATARFAVALRGIVRHRQEVLVQPLPDAQPDGMVSGFCTSPGDDGRIPLLTPWPQGGEVER